ncbi:MAG: Abortive infection protein [Schlesneria sp.]|nr:Abortive infection protein [Schlesneria sp.]
MDPDEASPSLETRAIPLESIPVEEAIEITDGDLISPEPSRGHPFDGAFRRPGFFLSLLWMFLLMAAQVGIGVAFAVVIVVGLVIQHQGPLNEDELTRQLSQSAGSWMLPVASFSTMAVAFAVVLALFWKQTARCMGLRGMSATQTLLIAMAAVPMAVLTSEFTNWVQYLFPNLSMLEMFADFSTSSWWLIFAAGCLFPGVGEELFFRGFLSRGLVSRYGVYWGSISTAFLFGAMHIHPVQASGAFMLGLVLQFVFLTTQSLWGAVLLHTLNNALAFGAMKYGAYAPIPGFTAGTEEGIAHTPMLLIVAAILSAAMILFALYQTRTHWRRVDGTEWSRGFVTAEGPTTDENVQRASSSISLRDCAGVLLMYAILAAALFASVAT